MVSVNNFCDQKAGCCGLENIFLGTDEKESSIEAGWEGVQGILLARAAGLLSNPKKSAKWI